MHARCSGCNQRQALAAAVQALCNRSRTSAEPSNRDEEGRVSGARREARRGGHCWVQPWYPPLPPPPPPAAPPPGSSLSTRHQGSTTGAPHTTAPTRICCVPRSSTAGWRGGVACTRLRISVRGSPCGWTGAAARCDLAPRRAAARSLAGAQHLDCGSARAPPTRVPTVDALRDIARPIPARSGAVA